MHPLKRIFLLGSLTILTFGGLLHLLGHLDIPQEAKAATAGSTANCFVYDGSTIYSSIDEQAIQQAIDAAAEGTLLKIAGSCRGAHPRAGVTQTVFISKSVRLQGGYTLTNWLAPDASANPTILDAQSTGRVVYITGPIQVTLDRLSLLNGYVHNGNGGGIYHNATLIEAGSGIYHSSALTVTNSTIANGRVAIPGFAFPHGFGGGIASAEGRLHLENSLITGSQAAAGGALSLFLTKATIHHSNIISNSATEGGGGIILGYSVLTMTNSTIALNEASSGGGIENDVDSMITVVNSTVSGNTAVYDGGGLDSFLNGAATLINTTFSHNVAGRFGGGIYNSAVITLSNSIISNSSGGDCWHVGSADNLIDQGFNLVEDGSCDFAVGGDPQLEPLADNGGSSWTHALLPDSPALDAGNCANGTIATDQRDIPRPQGDACDIGAFERAWPTQFLPLILNQTE